MLIIGIDPGLDGALVLMGTDGEILNKCIMPIIETQIMRQGKKRKKRLINEEALFMTLGFWTAKKEVRIFLEYVNAMPDTKEKDGKRQTLGAASVFNFGADWGLIRGMCLGLTHWVHGNKPYELVHSRSWTNKMCPKMNKIQRRPVVARLWPDEDFKDPTKPRAYTPHGGYVDAVLIAEYARQYIVNK